MKLIYLIPGTYRAAGMERVLAEKANWLAGHGYEVLIVTCEQKGREPAFGFDSRIRFEDLAIGYEENNGGSFADKLIHYPAKQRKHRKALEALLRREKADIVVSMFGNEAGFLPRIKDGSRKVLEVHFSRFKKLQYGRRGLWALADRWRTRQDAVTASKYDRFVVLTKEDSGYWGPLGNIRVIPNPRTFTFEQPASLESKTVLAVGRYTHQKGFDMLLEAWRKIDTADWTLRIAGSGEPLGDVPSNVVTGPSDDIRSEYLSAAFLVMSSRYEGLPMVLLEAQAAGLPAVSFACKCGPKDVITDGRDGILVPEGDIDGLAAGMRKLMDDKELRLAMGKAAYRNSDRYDKETIMALWENLFRELS